VSKPKRVAIYVRVSTDAQGVEILLWRTFWPPASAAKLMSLC